MLKKHPLLFKSMNACLFAAYAGALFFIATRPFPDTSMLVRVINNIAHIPSFALLAIILFIFSETLFIQRRLYKVIFSVAGSVVFGIVIEFYQAGIPGRESSFIDFLLNITGIVLGLGIIHAFRNSLFSKKQINAKDELARNTL